MTTITLQEFTLSPEMVLSSEDYRRLSQHAHSGISTVSTIADDLLYELDRAKILPMEQVSVDAVRMGSCVRFRTDEGDEREVTPVFPFEADIDQNRVSGVTLIGATLIGRRTRQSIA